MIISIEVSFVHGFGIGFFFACLLIFKILNSRSYQNNLGIFKYLNRGFFNGYKTKPFKFFKNKR